MSHYFQCPHLYFLMKFFREETSEFPLPRWGLSSPNINSLRCVCCTFSGYHALKAKIRDHQLSAPSTDYQSPSLRMAWTTFAEAFSADACERQWNHRSFSVAKFISYIIADGSPMRGELLPSSSSQEENARLFFIPQSNSPSEDIAFSIPTEDSNLVVLESSQGHSSTPGESQGTSSSGGPPPPRGGVKVPFFHPTPWEGYPWGWGLIALSGVKWPPMGGQVESNGVQMDPLSSNLGTCSVSAGPFETQMDPQGSILCTYSVSTQGDSSSGDITGNSHMHTEDSNLAVIESSQVHASTPRESSPTDNDSLVSSTVLLDSSQAKLPPVRETSLLNLT